MHIASNILILIIADIFCFFEPPAKIKLLKYCKLNIFLKSLLLFQLILGKIIAQLNNWLNKIELYNLPFYILIFLYDKFLFSIFLDFNLFKFAIKRINKTNILNYF